MYDSAFNKGIGMNYLHLFSEPNLAAISDWLNESGELYVDVYLPHSGGGSSAYLIHSIHELKSLITRQSHPEIAISVFRDRQYPLRGIADETLLKQSLHQIQDGDWYSIISLELSLYPSYIAVWGNGRSHKELQRDFADVLGEPIAIGQDPFDVHSPEWFAQHPEKVLIASILRKNNYTVERNQENYQPFESEPEKYRQILELWQA